MVNNILETVKLIHIGDCKVIVKEQNKQLDHLKTAVLTLAAEKASLEYRVSVLETENEDLKNQEDPLDVSCLDDVCSELPNGE